LFVAAYGLCFGHQRESSATEDSENDDKVKFAFSVLFA